MSATYSTNIRGFSASAFVDALKNSQLNKWTTGTLYQIGSIVYYGSKKYAATTAGTSGATPPTHSLGIYSDGGVSWIFVETISVDNNFKNYLYLFYGKTSAWTDENNPDTASASSKDEYTILPNIVALKKITPSNVKLAARKYTWTSGVTYTQFDPTKDVYSSINYPTPFYIINSNNEIFKCLNNNNNSPSTSEPIGSSLNHIKTIDGYVWFYLGTLSSTNSLLMTTDFFPVDSIESNDGSDQWAVQQNAKTKSISTFKVMAQNSTLSGSLTTTVFGDGSSATASAVLSGTNVSQVLINNPGTGYIAENTYAEIKAASAVGSGALITPVLYFNSVNPTVTILNQGSGYTTASATITPVTTGSGATASVQIGTGLNAGKIVGITITNPGHDYAGGANIAISGNGTNASASLTINTTGIIGNITINIGHAGSGYTGGANIIIVGDGSGASATATITAGSLSQVNMLSFGTGYTYAKAFVIPGTAGAIAYPIMAPVTGHGANMAAELAVNNALIIGKVDSTTDSSYFTASPSVGYRQIGLITNIIDNFTNLDATQNLYIGPSHSDYSNGSSPLNKIKASSGYVLYINNVTKFTRSSTQEEDVKIAISF